MIGDDVINDVGGAQRCGLFGVLVKTGKYRLAQPHLSLSLPPFLDSTVVGE